MTESGFIIISIILSIITTVIIVYFFIKNNYLRIIFGILLPIILSPILYFLSIFIVIGFAESYNDNSKFDSKKWKEDKSFRLKCGKDLDQSDILKNKSKSEVIKLLGEPGNTMYSDGCEILTYYLDEETWRDKYINVFFMATTCNDTVIQTSIAYN